MVCSIRLQEPLLPRAVIAETFKESAPPTACHKEQVVSDNLGDYFTYASILNYNNGWPIGHLVATSHTTRIRECPKFEYTMITGHSTPQTPSRTQPQRQKFKPYDDSLPNDFDLCRKVSLHIPRDFIKAYTVTMVAIIHHVPFLT